MKFLNKQNIIWLVLIPLAFILGLLLNSGSEAPVLPAQAQTAGATQGSIWTCSMHPQIKQPNPGQCPICGMDLIPVAGSSDDGPGFREIKLSERARKLAAITTAPVKRMSVSSDLKLVGKVTYDETRLAYIASRVDGRIDLLYADYTGTIVKTGDKLVDIYSPELLSTQQELLEAQKLLQQNPDSESVIYRSAQKNISAVRERLRLWGFSDQQIASIEKGQQPSDHLTIYAPLSGTVIHKNAVEGAYVKTGMNIYTIADLSQVWVMLEAYESDLPFLRLGQTVEFTSESEPGETFTGKISFIDPVLDDQSRTVNVRVQSNNDRYHLKPDMFVRAVVKIHPESGNIPPLVIPASAALITGKRAVVYVAETGKEGVFQGRDITLGPRAGDYYIVKDGLKEGENVVVNGAFKIDSEAQIHAKPSMMNPESSSEVDAEENTEEEVTSYSVPSEFLNQLDGVYNAYFKVQYGLSHDNLENAKNAATALDAELHNVQMELLKSDTPMAWREDLKMIRFSTDQLRNATDIEKARSDFAGLSIALIRTAKQFGTSGKQAVLVYHCPMAFNNKGADWLQNKEGTENPYFGSSMFKCGSKIEDLTKK